MADYVIGLDYGTESARAILVNCENGEFVGEAVHIYKDGVIDEVLPESKIHLPSHWALQNPENWLAAAEDCIPRILKATGIQPHEVRGLGVDFTACTLLPVTADGTPLHLLPELSEQPHAWCKLWKHHGAQPQADRINMLAKKRGEPWINRYGGMISSEWLLPKALEVLENAPHIYHKARYFVEGADWLIWQFTGELVQNACAAGYKGTWHNQDGYPSRDFLAQLNPEIEELFDDKVIGNVLPPGRLAGKLSSEWAEKLGLRPDMPVATAIIDAHSAVIGGGVYKPGTMFIIMGTSSCHMLMHNEEVLVEGISGVVEGGIVPGLYGYEAGQAGVGDIFAWFVEHAVPGEYFSEAEQREQSIHDLLSEKAADLFPGESGLIALDWWNGCRTPLVDADLTGVLLGYHLNTRPEEVYRALIEATAFGTRLIIELFKEKGVPINKLLAGGGLTKNNLLLQIYADIIGLPIEIAASPQSSALGAAILASVAGDIYPDIEAAVSNMVPAPSRKIQPEPASKEIYDNLFAVYGKMVKDFGMDKNSPLKELLNIKKKVNQRRA